MSRIFRCLTFVICMLAAMQARAQDSSHSLIPFKYLDQVSSKAASLESKLDKQSEKALAQLQKQEEKLKSKLSNIDSIAAKKIFADADAKYKELEQRLQNAPLKQYLPRLDSISTSLKFLQQNPQILSEVKEVKEKLTSALTKVKGLQDQFQKAEEIKKFLKERKQFLKDQLSKFGFMKEFKKLNKQVYYYSQQVAEYKAILNDPKKIEKKALELLSKTKFFQEFMKKNSMLASLFRMPGDPNDPAYTASLAGLQTRVQVNSLIQQQIQSGGPNAQQQFQQNIQTAQSQLQQLKDKVLKFGGGNSDDVMPEGFQPNSERTKSLWKRIEIGANIQNQKSNGLLPTTSDIGLSLGFKANNRSVIGVGTSFKLGWGRDIRHIKLSGQGLSLRSFVDIKLKGSFWISGAYEMNYRSAFRNIVSLQQYADWQKSCLVGISKTIPVKTKFFKKTSVRLMFDFLSYRQVPKTQPIIFRIGYNF